MDEPTASQYSASSDVLHSAMESLHHEVNEAEKKIQVEFQAILSEATLKWEQQYNASNAYTIKKNQEIAALKLQVKELEGIQDHSQHDKTKLKSELNETREKLTLALKELQETKSKYLKDQEIFKSEKCQLDKYHEQEVAKYKSTIQELSCSLKEYQTKFTGMTAKINQLSEKMITGKSSSDKAKKAISSQLSNQTTEARKSALEVSKLKTDVSNTNKALATAKQTIKKLQLQLHEMKVSSETTITELHKQHSVQLKILNEEILALQHQLEELKRLHYEEIESLKTNNHESKRDDFLEARIAFLQHQNRREKVQIEEKHKGTK